VRDLFKWCRRCETRQSIPTVRDASTSADTASESSAPDAALRDALDCFAGVTVCAVCVLCVVSVTTAHTPGSLVEQSGALRRVAAQIGGTLGIARCVVWGGGGGAFGACCDARARVW
jgi:hypothetical protein